MRAERERYLMLSANFYADGTFNSQDQVPTMINSDGQNAAPVLGIGIEPWESVPIEIVCVDISIFQGAEELNYSFAGNGFSPDIMRWHGQPNPIPAGSSFSFPAKGASPPPHIDCHVSGTSGAAFQLFYTVYYNK
jgi:hypothetical protein